VTSAKFIDVAARVKLAEGLLTDLKEISSSADYTFQQPDRKSKLVVELSRAQRVTQWRKNKKFAFLPQDFLPRVYRQINLMLLLQKSKRSKRNGKQPSQN
jgi:hypothetical protein